MLVAVLADIHANLEALTEVLKDMDRHAPAEAICMGDVVGYGPDPEEVVRLVRERNILCTQGNHEAGLTSPAARKWFNPKARATLDITASLLSADSLDWLGGLPASLVRHGARFVHGLPRENLFRYLFQVRKGDLPALFEGFEERTAFVGHTHELRLVTLADGRLSRTTPRSGRRVLDRDARHIVNVGSVGQPRDTNNQAKYVLWDTETDELRFRFISYDISATTEKILRRGIDSHYADMLR